MIIQPPDPETHKIDDYDFQFINGMFLQLSINEQQGDTVDFDTTPLAALFHLAPKPSPTDETAKIPAEDVTVMMSHVLTIAKRTRFVVQQTSAEKDYFKLTLNRPPKQVQ